MIPVSRIVSSSVFFFISCMCKLVLARELSHGAMGVRFWCVFPLISIMAEPVPDDEVLGAQGQTNTGMGCSRTSPKFAHSRVHYIIG